MAVSKNGGQGLVGGNVWTQTFETVTLAVDHGRSQVFDLERVEHDQSQVHVVGLLPAFIAIDASTSKEGFLVIGRVVSSYWGFISSHSVGILWMFLSLATTIRVGIERLSSNCWSVHFTNNCPFYRGSNVTSCKHAACKPPNHLSSLWV